MVFFYCLLYLSYLFLLFKHLFTLPFLDTLDVIESLSQDWKVNIGLDFPHNTDINKSFTYSNINKVNSFFDFDLEIEINSDILQSLFNIYRDRSWHPVC